MKLILKKIAFLFIFFAAKDIFAAKIAQNCNDASIGTLCYIQLSQIHPTQTAVGFLEVQDKVDYLKGLSNKKIKKYMIKKEIPIIIASGAEPKYYTTDRHHLLRALWENGTADIIVKVIGKIPNDSKFWQQMQDNNWTWLKDIHGNDITPNELPTNISGLIDNPYRSLAGYLKDKKFFNKNGRVYFIEFFWANWLGNHMNWVDINKNNLHKNLEQAELLACSIEAKNLPGYPGIACKK